MLDLDFIFGDAPWPTEVIRTPNPATHQPDIDSPAGTLTEGLLERLRTHEAELLAIRRGDAEALQAQCEATGEREAIAWCENGPAHEVDAALRAAIDGFEQLYRSEGLEPVEVEAHGGAGQDLAAAIPPRPRSAVPVAVEWPGATADFCLLLTADDLPEVPFRLNGWTQVTDAAKMLLWLQEDTRRGPSGSRARYGSLQADLLALQRFVLQAAEDEPQDCPRIDADGATRPQCIEPRPGASERILGVVPRDSGNPRELATAPREQKSENRPS